MSETTTRLTGGCQCGAVRYALTAPPTRPSVCHCRMCQRAGGAPYMAFVGVRLSEIAWTGSPKTFVSSSHAERGFCAACGTPLTYRFRDTDRIAVTIPSLDDPEAVAPTMQNGIESRLSWTDGVRDLPSRPTEAWLNGETARDFASRQYPGEAQERAR